MSVTNTLTNNQLNITCINGLPAQHLLDHKTCPYFKPRDHQIEDNPLCANFYLVDSKEFYGYCAADFSREIELTPTGHDLSFPERHIVPLPPAPISEEEGEVTPLTTEERNGINGRKPLPKNVP